MQDLPQVLEIADVWTKLSGLEAALHQVLLGHSLRIPAAVGREVEVRGIRNLPPKPGLSTSMGVARLIHDLASIELQALEMMLRTLSEYPEAPREFRRRLGELVLDEGRHLRLCLEELKILGHPWGTWPVHIGLWQCVRLGEPLLSRVLIVHRYLEGSGLDAGETLARRLKELNQKGAHSVVNTIYVDEMDHVRFGSEWYRQLSALEKIDPDEDFERRIWQLRDQLPRRLEPISHVNREQAGFSAREIRALERLQSHFRSRPNQSGILQDRI